MVKTSFASMELDGPLPFILKLFNSEYLLNPPLTYVAILVTLSI
jgi:hypothetical protein